LLARSPLRGKIGDTRKGEVRGSPYRPGSLKVGKGNELKVIGKKKQKWRDK